MDDNRLGMKTHRTYLLSLISHYATPRGFTLIELIIVFGLVTFLSVAGVASFVTFNNAQGLQTSVNDVVVVLDTAKSRSLTQVKPPQCGTQTLQGYQVTFSVPASTYQLSVLCGGNTYPIGNSKRLPAGVTFVAGSTAQIRFAISTGTATPGTITVNGNNTTKTITVNSIGNIEVR